MSRESWQVTAGPVSARRIAVGPENDSLPNSFTATCWLGGSPFGLELECFFDGTRIQVHRIVIADKKREGRPITPRDVAAIDLAHAVRIAGGVVAEPANGAITFEERPSRRPTPTELKHVAAVYAMQYAIWGSPRQRVMEMWQLPRSTANRWIRKARELHPDMPGDDGGSDHE